MCRVLSRLQLFSRSRRHFAWLPVCLSFVAFAVNANAQPAANQPNGLQPAGNLPNVVFGPGGQQQNGLVGGVPNGNTPGRGASANADFESLMDLITSTIHPELWADNGGIGDIRPFYGGVLVDAAGTLRLRAQPSTTNELLAKRGSAPIASIPRANHGDTPANAVRTESPLRYVSLPRLEREIARRQAEGRSLEPAMLTLAGLQRVQYVFVYPESGDLVLAGPAGDWRVNDEARIVSKRTDQPVVRLDDLLVLLRRDKDAPLSHFGCSINPRQEALAKTQAFLASSSHKPLQPGERKKWLGELRDQVGTQDIEIFGVDPASRVASVLVEADYHMKLIGMGLSDGVDGVVSYLDSVEKSMNRDEAASPPMSVLRWWFALNYEAIHASPDGTAFELVGQGVRVLSENEMLAEQGRRVHTGKSDPLNQQFAESFTAHFEELAEKYPVYGELRNIFDLAMAAALIQREGLAAKASWQSGLFASDEKLPLPQAAVPRQVETVINHRVVKRTQIIAGVSGGVMVAPADVLNNVHTSSDKAIVEARLDAPKKSETPETWWWDGSE
jgi:hypothetical protein